MTERPPPSGEREESLEDLWLFIIVNTTILALLVNILALHYGTTMVATNLLYIPIVITAYWYPHQGVTYAAVVSALYIGFVVVITGGAPGDLVAAIVTCIVVMGVAAVVTSLALHMRRNEVKYRGIFNHSEAGIGLVNSSDRMIKEVNRRFADTLGYTPAEVESVPFPRIWSDEADRERFFQILASKGNVENFETRFLTKTGMPRWVFSPPVCLQTNSLSAPSWTSRHESRQRRRSSYGIMQSVPPSMRLPLWISTLRSPM